MILVLIPAVAYLGWGRFITTAQRAYVRYTIENAIETLNAQIGQPSQPTDWFEITQERVNTFADATLDSSGFTWIPSVRKRSVRRADCPRSVDAVHHEFLPGGAGVGLPSLDGMKLGINYGWNKVRFMNLSKLARKFARWASCLA